MKIRLKSGRVPPNCGPEFPVELKVNPLASDKGDALVGSVNWIQVNPAKGKVSEKAPLEIEVTATLPDEVSGDLEDGLYSGSIQVVSPNLEEEYTIPLELPIRVPAIQVLSQLTPGKPNDILSCPFWCPNPGNRPLDVLIRTTSPYPAKIEVGIGGFNGPDQKNPQIVDPQNLHLSPRFNTDNPLSVGPDTKYRMAFDVVASSPARLKPGIYRAELVMRGDSVRTRTIDLKVDIPSRYPALWVIMGVGTLLGLLLIVPAGLWFSAFAGGLDGTGGRFRGRTIFSSYRGGLTWSGRSFTLQKDDQYGWSVYVEGNHFGELWTGGPGGSR